MYLYFYTHNTKAGIILSVYWLSKLPSITLLHLTVAVPEGLDRNIMISLTCLELELGWPLPPITTLKTCLLSTYMFFSHSVVVLRNMVDEGLETLVSYLFGWKAEWSRLSWYIGLFSLFKCFLLTLLLNTELSYFRLQIIFHSFKISSRSVSWIFFLFLCMCILGYELVICLWMSWISLCSPG